MSIACIAIGVLVLLNVAWEVAVSLFPIGWIGADRRLGIPYEEAAARGRLMFDWCKDTVAGRPAAATASQVAKELSAVLSGKKLNIPMRYAVAAIDGKLYVAEMPPEVLLHHYVMYSDGRVVVQDDENLLAAIWERALQQNAIVEAVPGPPSVTTVSGHGFVNRPRSLLRERAGP